MLRLLMGPSNAVCDILRVKDEGERGMIRMLVNMMILTFVAVIVFVVVIEAIDGLLASQALISASGGSSALNSSAWKPQSRISWPIPGSKR